MEKAKNRYSDADLAEFKALIMEKLKEANEDFDLYHYDNEKDCYIFEGEEWDNDSEIKEELLDRKIRLYDQQSLHSGDSASQN